MPQQYASIDVREWADADYESLREAFEWDLPDDYNVATELVEAHAGSGRTALRYERADGEVTSYTFADVDRRAGLLASWLAARGVGRGDHVGVALGHHPVTLLTHVATYKLGAVAVPMSVLLGSDGVAYRVETAEVTALVTAPGFVESVRGSLGTVDHVLTVGETGEFPSYEEAIAAVDEPLSAVATDPDDPAVVLFTSGTTGDPKGVVHGHRCLAGFHSGFELMNEFPGDGAVVATPADWAWVAGTYDTTFPAWWGGRTVVGYESRGFDPRRVLELFERHGVTHTLLTPTMIRLLQQEVQRPVDDYDLSVEVVVTGGEPTGEPLFEYVREGFDAVCNEHYGQTEADVVLLNSHRTMDAVPDGSLGKPGPGHEVAVLDDEGRQLPDGERGEIAVRRPDPVVMVGRLDDGAVEPPSEGWFRTGDLGYRDEDGFFWFAGRSDDLIVTSGYRVSPVEVERKLTDHPDVANAVVVGTPDETRGEVVTAAVKPTTDADVDDPAELAVDLRRLVKDDLAKYEYPRRVEVVDDLPTTATGKVDRHRVAEWLSDAE